MKLFTAGVRSETNTFSPLPTGYDDYADHYLTRGGVAEGDPRNVIEIPPKVWRRRAAERGWTLVESLFTASGPSNKTARAVWEGFREDILADLRAAMPVDGVLLHLHGAMVAHGYDDCEGDLLQAIRGVVGPDVPIGAELDPHCHLTPAMVAHADVLLHYKEYPHIDYAERAEELFTLLADVIEGRTKPHMAVYDCRMMDFYFTTIEPMKGFVARMKELEREPGVLSISCNHGFPCGDVPEIGTRMLVVTDNQPERGQALAKELGQELIAMRGQTRPAAMNIAEAVTRTESVLGDSGNPLGPVVWADFADNAGGGSSSDSVAILAALLERGERDAAIAMLWDPIAVRFAHAAGEGAQLRMRIGGKADPNTPGPLDLDVTVIGLARDVRVPYAGAMLALGDLAAVRCQGVDVVLSARREQCRALECFTAVKVDPRQKDIVVVKSTNHFRAAFEPIASEILYVAAAGSMNPDLTQLPFERVRRPIWPLDEDPWGMG